MLLRDVLVSVLVLVCTSVACAPAASTATGDGSAGCRGAPATMTQTQVENALAMMDSWCLGRGWSFGCVEWGDGLENGRCGLPRDRERARRYYARACQAQYPPGCNALGRMGATP